MAWGDYRNQSDADAAAALGGAGYPKTPDTDPFMAGQQAFWRCEARATPKTITDAGKAAKWSFGWDTAAREAARTLRQHRAVIANAKTIRDAMMEAGYVLRSVREQWTKQPHGLKSRIAQAQMLINNALAYVPDIDKPAPEAPADNITGGVAGATRAERD